MDNICNELFMDMKCNDEWDEKMGVGNHPRFVESIFYPSSYSVYASTKHGASIRGIGFFLNPEDFDHWWCFTPHECYYCGMTWAQYIETRDFIVSYTGDDPRILRYRKFLSGQLSRTSRLTIDRRNNLEGYKPKNIVKSCWYCNSAKGHFFEEDDIALVMKAAKEKLLKAIAYHNYIEKYGEPERCDA